MFNRAWSALWQSYIWLSSCLSEALTFLGEVFGFGAKGCNEDDEEPVVPSQSPVEEASLEIRQESSQEIKNDAAPVVQHNINNKISLGTVREPRQEAEHEVKASQPRRMLGVSPVTAWPLDKTHGYTGSPKFNDKNSYEHSTRPVVPPQHIDDEPQSEIRRGSQQGTRSETCILSAAAEEELDASPFVPQPLEDGAPTASLQPIDSKTSLETYQESQQEIGDEIGGPEHYEETLNTTDLSDMDRYIYLTDQPRTQAEELYGQPTKWSIAMSSELWSKVPGAQLIGQAALQLAYLGETLGSGIVVPPLRVNDKTPAASIKISDETWLQIHEKFKREIRDEIEGLERPGVTPVTGRGWSNDLQETRLKTNSATLLGTWLINWPCAQLSKAAAYTYKMLGFRYKEARRSPRQLAYLGKKEELIRPLDKEQAKKLYLDPDSTEFSYMDREKHFTDQLKILYADKAITSLDDLQKTELKTSGTTLSAPMKRALDGHLMQLKSISFADTTDDSEQYAGCDATEVQKAFQKAVELALSEKREEWAKDPKSPVNIMGLPPVNMTRGTTQELLVSYLAQMLGGTESAPVIHHDKYQKTAQLADLDKSVWPPADRAMGHFASKYIGHPNTSVVRPLSEFAPYKEEEGRCGKLMGSITGAASLVARNLCVLGNIDLHGKHLLVEDVVDIHNKTTHLARAVDYGAALTLAYSRAGALMQLMITVMQDFGLAGLPMDTDLFKRTIHDVLRSFAINGDRKCGLNVAYINDCLAIGVERFKQAVECGWPKEEWDRKSQDIRSQYQPIDVEGFWAALTKEPGPTKLPEMTSIMIKYAKAHSDDVLVRQINDAKININAHGENELRGQGNDTNVAAISWAQRCAYYIKLRCEVDHLFEIGVQRTALMTIYEKQSAKLVGGNYTLTMEHFTNLLLSVMSLQQAAETAEQYSRLGIVAMTNHNLAIALQNFYTTHLEMVPLLDMVDSMSAAGADSAANKDLWLLLLEADTRARIEQEANRIHDDLDNKGMLYSQIEPSPNYLALLDEICDAEDRRAGKRLQKLLGRNPEEPTGELSMSSLSSASSSTTLYDSCSEGISKEVEGAIGLSACP